MQLKNLRYLRVDNETLHIILYFLSFVITLKSKIFHFSHLSSSNVLSLSLSLSISLAAKSYFTFLIVDPSLLRW
jgi:hypothetical protein